MTLNLKDIPVARPKIPDLDAVRPYLDQMQDTRIYSNHGPLVQLLEQRIAELLRVRSDEVVACASATVGLENAFLALGIQQAVIPAFSFAATGLAAKRAGVRVVWTDVDEEGLAIFELARHPSTLPRVVVAPFGRPVDTATLEGSHKGVVDAAGSLGTSLGVPFAIPKGWAAVFSLHATKALGIGEGGLVVFGSASDAEKFRSLINFGYESGRIGVNLGTNGKMPEISAAFAHASLDQRVIEEGEWHSAQTRAREVILDSFSGLRLFSARETFHPYLVLKAPNVSDLERIRRFLRESSIGFRDWWAFPLPAMKSMADSSSEWAMTQALCDTTIGLPMFREISLRDIDATAKAVLRASRDTA